MGNNEFLLIDVNTISDIEWICNMVNSSTFVGRRKFSRLTNKNTQEPSTS